MIEHDVRGTREGRTMAVAADTERVADVRRYRFTVDEFARMGEALLGTSSRRRSIES